MSDYTPYQPPIDKLLTLGKRQYDYIKELGLGLQHIPDLMRMAVDNELLGADSNSTEFWAAIHAWRALGQLKVEDAIALLLPLFHELEDNDAIAEEMPKIFGTIGEKAIPQLQAYLAERSHSLFGRVTAINSLEEIATHYVNTRNQVVVVLIQQLKLLNQNSSELNGFIVSSLVNLQAKESGSVIKYAFDTSLVADDIAGSWDDVRESLGISDNEELEEFQPEASQEVIEVVELSTPVINVKVPIPAVEEVEEETTPVRELHQDNAVVEPVEEVEEVTIPFQLYQDNITVEPVEEVEEVEEVTTPPLELHQDNITVEPTEEVGEVTTPSLELHQDNVTVEEVEEVTIPSLELHQDNIVVEPILEAEEVSEATTQTQEVIKAGSENIEESSLSDTVAEAELILEDVTSKVDIIPIEASVKESIRTTDTIIDNYIESPEKPSSGDETSISTAKEQNKGFGSTSTKKDKSKASKKKKANFTDL